MSTVFTIHPLPSASSPPRSCRQLKKRQPLNLEDRGILLADPPCARGERRFRIEFAVDGEKRLTVSVTDNNPNGKSRLILGDGRQQALPIVNEPILDLNG